MDIPCIDLEATGRNLRSLRKANGLRVTDISSELTLDKQAVYKWEYGKCLPQVDNLLALARLYHLSMEDILVIKKEGQEALPFPFLFPHPQSFSVPGLRAVPFLMLQAVSFF